MHISSDCLQIDHQYYHKWAPLIDPRDMAAGPKGYVKCDISVTGKGDLLKVKAKRNYTSFEF